MAHCPLVPPGPVKQEQDLYLFLEDISQHNLETPIVWLLLAQSKITLAATVSVPIVKQSAPKFHLHYLKLKSKFNNQTT